MLRHSHVFWLQDACHLLVCCFGNTSSSFYFLVWFCICCHHAAEIYVNWSTCSNDSPFTVIWQVGLIAFFENTITKDFLLMSSPFVSLFVQLHSSTFVVSVLHLLSELYHLHISGCWYSLLQSETHPDLLYDALSFPCKMKIGLVTKCIPVWHLASSPHSRLWYHSIWLRLVDPYTILYEFHSEGEGIGNGNGGKGKRNDGVDEGKVWKDEG